LRYTSVGGDDDSYTMSDFTDNNYVFKGYLVDPVAKKKYLAVMDSKNKCLCSEFNSIKGGGATYDAWVTYPPIPDGKDLNLVLPKLPRSNMSRSRNAAAVPVTLLLTAVSLGSSSPSSRSTAASPTRRTRSRSS
jgi:hypothetical protein